jgi:hypothetical protein
MFQNFRMLDFQGQEYATQPNDTPTSDPCCCISIRQELTATRKRKRSQYLGIIESVATINLWILLRQQRRGGSFVIESALMALSNTVCGTKPDTS